MSPPITLTDDGELTEAVEVPDPTAGATIHFTTGRAANYPAAAAPLKGKHRRHVSILDLSWTAWLLVVFCTWALFTIILFIIIGH